MNRVDLSQLNERRRTEIIENVWPWFDATFPVSEHRSLASMKRLCLAGEAYHPLVFCSNDEYIAVMWYWSTPNFVYLEHFAVRPDKRGQGLGEALLTQFLAEHPALALHVETPDSSSKWRRVHFYERHDLILNSMVFHYPVDQYTPEPLDLSLMTHGRWSMAQIAAFRRFEFDKLNRYV